MSALLTAAKSYYGLADASVRRTEMVTDNGQVIIVFEVAPTDDDMVGIVDRMKALREEHPMSADHEVKFAEGPDRESIRADYNAMSPAERSTYGSFARYAAARNMPDPWAGEGKITIAAKEDLIPITVGPSTGREVRHIDTPEPEDSGNHEAVWLDGKECNEAQKQFASDVDLKDDRYLIQEAMLTPEQRARHVQQPEDFSALQDHITNFTPDGKRRLSGEDGKPTSNADDFGGMPG